MALSHVADKLLSTLYITASLCGIIILGCSSLIWHYWDRTLNNCEGMNCGCILFGMWSFNSFYGGKIEMCRFVALSPIPAIVWSLIMAFFHCCFPRKIKPEIIELQLEGKIRLRNPQKFTKVQIKKRKLQVPAVVSLCLVIVTFSSCVVLSYGYNVTCREYKKAVIEQISASGNTAMMVYDRMSCGTVYDFLDYVAPDPPNLDPRYRRGSWIINSGLLLHSCLLFDWLSFIIFSLITVMNVSLSYNGQVFFF